MQGTRYPFWDANLALSGRVYQMFWREQLKKNHNDYLDMQGRNTSYERTPGGGRWTG